MEPQEMFDIYDEYGQWIGTKSRADVHRDGDWHRSFHCWVIYMYAGERYVILQHRSAHKDTFPLYFDISCAGHLSVGETFVQAVREMEEELGLSVTYEELVFLMEARKEVAGIAQQVPFIDREMSHVYGIVMSSGLEQITYDELEVQGIYLARLQDLQQLFACEPDQQQHAIPLQPLTLSQPAISIQKEQLVTRPDAYYREVFAKLAQL